MRESGAYEGGIMACDMLQILPCDMSRSGADVIWWGVRSTVVEAVVVLMGDGGSRLKEK